MKIHNLVKRIVECGGSIKILVDESKVPLQYEILVFNSMYGNDIVKVTHTDLKEGLKSVLDYVDPP